MDQNRAPTYARAIVYLGIAFSLFLAAEGIAHVSGSSSAAVATPAIAAETTGSPISGARAPLVAVIGDATYLPSQIRVQSNEPVGSETEMAPTF